MESKFTVISKRIVAVFAILFATSLVVMGVLSQIKIDISEIVYLFRTNILFMVVGCLVCIGIIILLLLISKRVSLSPNQVFLAILALGIFWVMVSQNAPTDDADHCLKIADELADGIYHSFESGQYMDVWRQQNMLVVYMYILTHIGGMYNYVLFQIINAFGFAWMCREGYGLIQKKNAQIAGAALGLMILYTPIWMSVTYVYGNLLGMVFGIVALVRQYYYFETSEKKYAIQSAFLIGIAIGFKMFYLIFLIAMVIMYIWNMIETKKVLLPLCWIVLCLFCYWGIGKAANVTIDNLSNHTLSEEGGVPMWASMVMGLDITEDMTNPGWYNAYNIHTYFDSDCKRELEAEANKADLRRVINRAADNSVKYLSLLYKKNHTVWNDPTFDVLYRARLETDTQIEDHANWYNDLMADSGRTHRILILFLQCMQVIIYLGVVIYCICTVSNKKYYELIGLISFIGGVLFITIWEAKSEYVLGYFLPLLVYAVIGYDEIINRIFAYKEQHTASKVNVKNIIVPSAVIIIAVICTIILMPHNTDEEAWNTYIEDHTYVSTGQYDLVTIEGNSPENLQNIYLDFDALYGTLWSYVICDNNIRYYFIFQNWDEIDRAGFPRLTMEEDGELNSLDLSVIEADNKLGYEHWKIYRNNGGYLICSMSNNNKVLTYDADKEMAIAADYVEGNGNQIWDLK